MSHKRLCRTLTSLAILFESTVDGKSKIYCIVLAEIFSQVKKETLSLTKKRHHIISFQPIDETVTPKPIHELEMQPRQNGPIGTFW